METEKLKFKIGLSGSHPDKQPEFRIRLNENEYVHTSLTKGPNEVEYFEFESELIEGDQTLHIELLNKRIGDTIFDETNNIIGDLLLSIESIEIDEIDIGSLKWTLSEYRPIYPKPHLITVIKETGSPPNEVVKNCVNLGWNGTWTLPFQSPFYIWLLENL